MTSAMEQLKQQTARKEVEQYVEKVIILKGYIANFSIWVDGKQLMFTDSTYQTTNRQLANRILADYPDTIYETKE